MSAILPPLPPRLPPPVQPLPAIPLRQNWFFELLAPLASLRLTLALLVLSMLLVYVGTCAQVDMGVWQVQDAFFHNPHPFAWVDFRTLNPFHAAGEQPSRLGFWIPSGYLIGLLLLLNLVAAHVVRFKFTWKRAGIILTHTGLVLLLVGEGLTANLKVESSMTIDVGSSVNYSEDARAVELAIVDPSPANEDLVSVISGKRLEDKGLVADSRLPFDVRVDEFYPNSEILGPQQARDMGLEAATGATAGAGKGIIARPQPRVSGADTSRQDGPSAYVTPIKDGKPIGGTYLVSMYNVMGIDQPQEVKVGDKSCFMWLRRKRLYKPYRIDLLEFTHKRYAGTDMAKDFASTIRLTDPERNEQRTVRIWMNHPLRYRGETFYQASFKPGDKTSILQVVSNPAWLLPYFACGIGGLGLLLHFGVMLVRFIDKQTSPKAVTTDIKSAGVLPNRGRNAAVNTGRTGKPAPGADRPFWMRWALIAPALTVGLFAVVVGSALTTRSQDGAYDLAAFGRIPVSFDGRTQPLDSLARNSMLGLRGRDTFLIGKESQPAIRFLVEAMARPDKAADYKIFRIDYPDLANILGDQPGEKFFSLNQVMARWFDLAAQWQRTSRVDAKRQDKYQTTLMDLAKKVQLYVKLTGAGNAAAVPLFHYPDPQLRALLAPNGGSGANGPATDRFSFDQYAQSRTALAPLVQQIPQDPRKRTAEQVRLIEFIEGMLAFDRFFLPEHDLPVVPPKSGEEEWQSMEVALSSEGKDKLLPEYAASLQSTLRAYAAAEPAAFNGAVQATLGTVRAALPRDASHVDFEAFYNRFDPVKLCQVFYLIIFFLAIVSWLTASAGWMRPLVCGALALLVCTFVLHTFALGARIYISGRPPVTNLASSAIFIGWAVAGLAIGIELLWRNGIASAVASVIGFVTVYIYYQLAMDSDTMKVLQAVLDTNIWLATHVVCVTLGYAATFLAGILGIAYFLVGPVMALVRRVQHAPADARAAAAPPHELLKALSTTIYGVTGFAIVFSFVGTVLGGIWADQSWGRFWGWDPKENGAALVVLSNALLLHARWSGIARARGIAALAIFGNIITAWSWFGTNMLDFGLHSYGRMEQGIFWLSTFIATQVAFIVLGYLPRSWWGLGAKGAA